MKLAISATGLLVLEWAVGALHPLGCYDWFRDRFMSKDCELKSVLEIVIEIANILRQADMAQLWEIHFSPRLIVDPYKSAAVGD